MGQRDVGGAPPTRRPVSWAVLAAAGAVAAVALLAPAGPAARAARAALGAGGGGHVVDASCLAEVTGAGAAAAEAARAAAAAASAGAPPVNTTVVTAFFAVPSKRPLECYLGWAANFMAIRAPVVLYTTPDLVPTLQALRPRGGVGEGGPPLLVVATRLEDTRTWRDHADGWRRAAGLDPEADRHSPALYALWAAKAEWVAAVAAANPFRTAAFMWTDVGAFRDAAALPAVAPRYPDARLFPPGQVLFSSVEDMAPGDLVRRPDGIFGDFLRADRIVGGLWGGAAEPVAAWADAFNRTLGRYFAADRFAGKDQSVMASAILEDPALAWVARPAGAGDKWFFLTRALAGAAPLERNPTWPWQPPRGGG
jgi:hypothetical protein